jgi:hypothetical protein
MNADKTQLFVVQHVSALCVHHQGAHIVGLGGLHLIAVSTRQAQLDLLYR